MDYYGGRITERLHTVLPGARQSTRGGSVLASCLILPAIRDRDSYPPLHPRFTS